MKDHNGVCTDEILSQPLNNKGGGGNRQQAADA